MRSLRRADGLRWRLVQHAPRVQIQRVGWQVGVIHKAGVQEEVGSE